MIPHTPTTAKRIKFCSQTHSLRSKSADFFMDMRLFSYLLQSVQFACFEMRASTTSTEPLLTTDIPSDTDTLDALHYVGGFFIRKLRSIKSDEIQTLLESWVSTSGEHSASTHSDWTQAQSCGGLVHVNSIFFDILLHLERVCTAYLQSWTLVNTNIRTRLVEHVMSDMTFDQLWESSCSELTGKSSEKLKSALVFKFCSLRSTAYTARLNAKLAPVVSTKPSASLRKQLRGEQP